GANLIERLICAAHLLQNKTREAAARRTVGPRLLFWRVAVKSLFQRYEHPAGLIHDCHSHRRRFDGHDDRGHDTEARHHDRQQNRRNDEHLRAYALHILALQDCEKLIHADSVTFVMKISLRLGSTISNFPITAPEAIKRFSSSCASAPAASSACASSACRITLLTSSGSSNTPSPPSQRIATELRPKLLLISRKLPSKILRDLLSRQMSSQIFSATSIWWVEKMIVLPARFRSSTISFSNSTLMGSRPENGSSRISRSGSCSTAVMNWIFCCIPFDSSIDRLFF